MSNPLPALTRHLPLSSSAAPAADSTETSRRRLLWGILLACAALTLIVLGLSLKRKSRHRRPALW